jgi:hypothetical protein
MVSMRTPASQIPARHPNMKSPYKMRTFPVSNVAGNPMMAAMGAAKIQNPSNTVVRIMGQRLR